MSIRAEQVAAAYSPLVQALDLQSQRNFIENRNVANANTTFDNAIQAQALPITRMLNTDNSINRQAIKSARPFADPYDMWEQLSANMPANRGVDPVVFQEKYQMGKQMFDMNLANQVAQMANAGMSDKKIRNALKENPDLYDYALQNSIVPREGQGFDLGGFIKDYGVPIGVGIGAERAFRKYAPPKPTVSGVKDLRSKGFKVVTENGQRKIRRLTDAEMYQKPRTTPGRADAAIKDAKEALAQKKRARNAAIKDSPDLERALKGDRAATNRVISKGARPAGKAATFLRGIANTAKGGGARAAAVGLGASLLADFLMNQGEE